MVLSSETFDKYLTLLFVIVVFNGKILEFYNVNAAQILYLFT